MKLRRQSCAALGSSCLDNHAATTGLHTGAETMGSGAFQVAGLKCTFHVFASILISCPDGPAGPFSGRRDTILI